MPDNFCSKCNSPAISSESVFCHKCGLRLNEKPASAAQGLLKSGSDDNKDAAGAQNAADKTGSAPGKEAAVKKSNSKSFFAEFKDNYYRFSFTASIFIMIAAIIYIISPLDIISDAPLISWIDDTLIFACALINLLHCGVDISMHSENVTFQRVKLILIPLTAVIIFLMWFFVNIVMILFQKR